MERSRNTARPTHQAGTFSQQNSPQGGKSYFRAFLKSPNQQKRGNFYDLQDHRN